MPFDMSNYLSSRPHTCLENKSVLVKKIGCPLIHKYWLKTNITLPLDLYIWKHTNVTAKVEEAKHTRSSKRKYRSKYKPAIWKLNFLVFELAILLDFHLDC